MLIAVLVLVALYELWALGHYLYHWWYGEETLGDEYETWECPACGCRIEAITIGGIVEGMRIHDIAMRCAPQDYEEEEK